jgi:antirestriction protein ArdC
MKLDTYQAVTDRIIAALEAGTAPWRMGWNAEGGAMGLTLPLRANGQEYRGINILLLWGAAEERGFTSPSWFTFKQASELGAKVRKGETATKIIFFKPLDVTRTNDAGEEIDAKIPMIKQYAVFNADQIDGLPERFAAKPTAPIGESKARDERAEAALRSTGADIREGGTQAYYSPGQDFVQMPSFDRFHTSGNYLCTLSHELCHWTGGDARLARKLRNQFGSKDYAQEELVAEIGAAFVGARLGIVGEHIDNHAAYIASWLAALKNDKRAIFKAASAAQAAADMVLAKSDLAAPTEAEEGEAAPTPAPTAPIAPEALFPVMEAPIDGERVTATIAARKASPMRPVDSRDTASTSGLALFDFADQPALL